MQEKKIIVQIGRPTSTNPTGLAAQGTYVETKTTVTLISLNNKPLSPDWRKQYSQRLKAGDNARVIAGRLTKECASAQHSNRPFSAPLNYPPIKVA